MNKIKKIKKIGLALGSGGARGYSHIGVIKFLLENNIKIDYVAGTSIGSLIGAYYSLHLEIKSLENFFLKFKKRDLLKLVDLNDPRKSLIKGEKIRNFLKQFFDDKNIEDCKIPYKCVATSLQTGKAIIFDKGNIINAIMASGCFPGVFPTIKYKDEKNIEHDLVDGGLADGLPIDVVKEMGADIIIGVDLYGFDIEKHNYNYSRYVIERTYQLLLSKLSYFYEKEYAKNVIILRPKMKKGIGTFAFYDAKEKIDLGYNEAKKNWDKIKKLILN
ncbi:MAG: patatin-like phospholipase family protein [Candidatus Woesearchaeota archaeon]